MAQDTKFITEAQRMQALGLFSMAHHHYAKAREFEEGLADLLGIEDGPYCGCLSDEMCDGGNFERGLKNEGYAVKAAKARKR